MINEKNKQTVSRGYHCLRTFVLLIFCFCVVLTGNILTGCKKHPKTVLKEASVPVVETMFCGKASDVERRIFPGFAKENKAAKVSFRTSGQLIELNAKIGAFVRKNDVLAKLDARDYELAVKRLEFSLAEANALYDAMKSGARTEDQQTFKAQLIAAQSAETQAKAQFDRLQSLLTDGTASQAQFDAAKTQYDLAVGHRETVEKQLEKAVAGARPEEIQAMKAKIEGLTTDLQLAQNKLNDTVLLAPFDGIVVQKYVEEHESILVGAPVLDLADARKIEVGINVPEDILIRENDFVRFECVFESFPHQTFSAQLKEIGQALQLGRQSYPMTLEISLPDNPTNSSSAADRSERTNSVHSDVANSETANPKIVNSEIANSNAVNPKITNSDTTNSDTAHSEMTNSKIVNSDASNISAPKNVESEIVPTSNIIDSEIGGSKAAVSNVPAQKTESSEISSEESVLRFVPDTQIRPGMAAEVSVFLRRQCPAILIPSTAVISDELYEEKALSPKKQTPKPSVKTSSNVPNQNSSEIQNQSSSLNQNQNLNRQEQISDSKELKGTGRVMFFDPKTSQVFSKPIAFSRFTEQGVEVIDGLSENDQIVIFGARFLTENQRVRQKKSDSN